MASMEELLRIQAKNNLLKVNQMRQKLLDADFDKKQKEKNQPEIQAGVLVGLNLFHHNLPVNEDQSTSQSKSTEKN